MGQQGPRDLSRFRFHDGCAGVESALTRRPSCPREGPSSWTRRVHRDSDPREGPESLNEREVSGGSLDERAARELKICPNCPSDLTPCGDRVPNGRFF